MRRAEQMFKKRKNVAKKERKQAAWASKCRHRYDQTLEFMGIAHLFPQFPEQVKEFILGRRAPKPLVFYDPGTMSHPDGPAIRSHLQELLDRATIKFGKGPLDGKQMLAGDFFSLCISARNSLHEAKKKLRGASPIVARAWQIGHGFVQSTIPEILRRLRNQLVADGWRHCQIDKVLLALSLSSEIVPGAGKRLKVAFTLEPARRLDVELDGKSRLAYQVGAPSSDGKITWLWWTGIQMGIEGDPTKYPVYIQAHALRRLEERLGLFEWRCHFYLWVSAVKARFSEMRGDQWLLEYRIEEHRLGYLVARRVGGIVVLTTFLFLTMQGTPEAKMLSEKLRLRRPDIEYQSLDKFSSFIGTDIRNDPLLVKLLEECGCGHLCNVGTLMDGTIKSGYADDLRKYLRLDDQKQLERLEDRLGIDFS